MNKGETKMRIWIIFMLYVIAALIAGRPELYTLAATIVPPFLVVPGLLLVYTMWVFAAAWTPQRPVVAKLDLSALQPKDIEQIATAVRFVDDLPLQSVGANLAAVNDLRAKIMAASEAATNVVKVTHTLRGQLKALDGIDIEELESNIDSTVTAVENATAALKRIGTVQADDLPDIGDVIDTLTSQIEKVRELVGEDGDALDEFSDDIDKVLEAKGKLEELFERVKV